MFYSTDSESASRDPRLFLKEVWKKPELPKKNDPITFLRKVRKNPELNTISDLPETSAVDTSQPTTAEKLPQTEEKFNYSQKESELLGHLLKGVHFSVLHEIAPPDIQDFVIQLRSGSFDTIKDSKIFKSLGLATENVGKLFFKQLQSFLAGDAGALKTIDSVIELGKKLKRINQQGTTVTSNNAPTRPAGLPRMSSSALPPKPEVLPGLQAENVTKKAYETPTEFVNPDFTVESQPILDFEQDFAPNTDLDEQPETKTTPETPVDPELVEFTDVYDAIERNTLLVLDQTKTNLSRAYEQVSTANDAFGFSLSELTQAAESIYEIYIMEKQLEFLEPNKNYPNDAIQEKVDTEIKNIDKVIDQKKYEFSQNHAVFLTVLDSLYSKSHKDNYVDMYSAVNDLAKQIEINSFDFRFFQNKAIEQKAALLLDQVSADLKKAYDLALGRKDSETLSFLEISEASQSLFDIYLLEKKAAFLEPLTTNTDETIKDPAAEELSVIVQELAAKKVAFLQKYNILILELRHLYPEVNGNDYVELFTRLIDEAKNIANRPDSFRSFQKNLLILRNSEAVLLNVDTVTSIFLSAKGRGESGEYDQKNIDTVLLHLLDELKEMHAMERFGHRAITPLRVVSRVFAPRDEKQGNALFNEVYDKLKSIAQLLINKLNITNGDADLIDQSMPREKSDKELVNFSSIKNAQQKRRIMRIILTHPNFMTNVLNEGVVKVLNAEVRQIDKGQDLAKGSIPVSATLGDVEVKVKIPLYTLKSIDLSEMNAEEIKAAIKDRFIELFTRAEEQVAQVYAQQKGLIKKGNNLIGIAPTTLRDVMNVNENEEEFKAAIDNLFNERMENFDKLMEQMSLIAQKLDQLVVLVESLSVVTRQKMAATPTKKASNVTQSFQSTFNTYLKEYRTIRNEISTLLETIAIEYQFGDSLADVLMPISFSEAKERTLGNFRDEKEKVDAISKALSTIKKELISDKNKKAELLPDEVKSAFESVERSLVALYVQLEKEVADKTRKKHSTNAYNSADIELEIEKIQAEMQVLESSIIFMQSESGQRLMLDRNIISSIRELDDYLRELDETMFTSIDLTKQIFPIIKSIAGLSEEMQEFAQLLFESNVNDAVIFNKINTVSAQHIDTLASVFPRADYAEIFPYLFDSRLLFKSADDEQTDESIEQFAQLRQNYQTRIDTPEKAAGYSTKLNEILKNKINKIDATLAEKINQLTIGLEFIGYNGTQTTISSFIESGFTEVGFLTDKKINDRIRQYVADIQLLNSNAISLSELSKLLDFRGTVRSIGKRQRVTQQNTDSKTKLSTQQVTGYSTFARSSFSHSTNKFEFAELLDSTHRSLIKKLIDVEIELTEQVAMYVQNNSADISVEVSEQNIKQIVDTFIKSIAERQQDLAEEYLEKIREKAEKQMRRALERTKKRMEEKRSKR